MLHRFDSYNKKEIFQKSCTLDVGISGHHHMVATIQQSEFTKSNPKTKFYRDYEIFDIEKFKTEFYSNIDKKEVYCYSSFHEAFTSKFHEYVPIKKKILRYNNNPYMMKTLRKAIMLRWKLKYKYKKNDNYKRQRKPSANPSLKY